VPLVAPADWAVRDGFGTCTMVRIHASYSILNDGNGGIAGASSIFLSVIVVDSDDATFNTLTATSRADTDILWQRTHLLQVFSDDSGTAENAWREGVIDIKVKRKLKADDFVYLTVHNANGYAGPTGLIWNMTSAVLLVPK